MTATYKAILGLMATLSFGAAANAQSLAHPFTIAPAEPVMEMLAEQGYALQDSMTAPSGHQFTIWCGDGNAGVMVVIVPDAPNVIVYQSVPVCSPRGEVS